MVVIAHSAWFQQVSWVSREKIRHHIAGGFIILSRYDKPSREKLLCIYSAQIPVKWHGAILIRPVSVSWRLAVHMRSFPDGAEPEAELWMCAVNSIVTVHWDPGHCITLYCRHYFWHDGYGSWGIFFFFPPVSLRVMYQLHVLLLIKNTFICSVKIFSFCSAVCLGNCSFERCEIPAGMEKCIKLYELCIIIFFTLIHLYVPGHILMHYGYIKIRFFL